MNVRTVLCPIIVGVPVLLAAAGCRGDRMVSRPYTAQEMQWGVMIRDSYPGWQAPYLSPRREDRATPTPALSPAEYPPAAVFGPQTPVRTPIASPPAPAPATTMPAIRKAGPSSAREKVILPPVRVDEALSPSEDWCPQEEAEPDYDLVPAEGGN
jgi:hypothetical protein